MSALFLRTPKVGRFLIPILTLFALLSASRAMAVSPLFARGYTVLPAPQSVTFTGGDLPFASGWWLELAAGVKPDDVAVTTLKQDLATRFGITLNDGPLFGLPAGIIRLAVVPGSVSIGDATDRDHAQLAEQAYFLSLKPQNISIRANASTGLFYGVETLIQLIRSQNEKFVVPAADITDWPNLQLRVIYWDDAHHLEHMDVLKTAIRQAAFYKINGFSIKLEGHFQYKSAAPIVEPYALAPAELQELTDFGLKYHVQLIPYLDGPAHDSFILKHPEYASLREYPESNYEFCANNPDTYKLFYRMFDDLLEANQGGKYFVLSTDEPYYVGLAKNAQCNEADRTKELGSVGKVLADFIAKTASYLHDRGRTVIFWGEYPMVPGDVTALPSYVVNGELYDQKFDAALRARGIRQLIYTSTEGEERLFPGYYLLPSSSQVHGRGEYQGDQQRVQGMADLLSRSSQSWPAAGKAAGADLMGAFVAGWADTGLHPETLWLGYATGPAAAWNRKSPDGAELMNTFYPLFYGQRVTGMGRLYQLMSEQARFWEDSWETGPSYVRTPIFGNSDGLFQPPRPAFDQSLPPLPVPAPGDLRQGSDWRRENTRRLELADAALAQNDQLQDLLHENLERADFNRYNLQVFLSVADLCRQNLQMLHALAKIDEQLQSAETAAAKPDAPAAVEALDNALDLAQALREERNQALDETTATWYQSWFPRVDEANGRRFLDQVDDVKDHVPIRTVDMSYLVYRELLYPLDNWARQVLAVRNGFAQKHGLAARKFELDWKDVHSNSGH